MKPQEALNLLDQAVAQLQAPRETHARLQQAVQIVSDALNKKS